MATYDTTALLADIRQRARAPSGTPSGWADADLLRAANDELLSVLVPEMLRLREEYFVTTYEVAFTAGTSSYALPSRAALHKLRSVGRLESDGTYHTLQKLNPEELDRRNLTDQSTPLYHYFERNKVVVYPPPDGDSGSLRVKYFRRPSRLVANTTGSSGNVALVASTSSTTITLSVPRPSAWTTGTVLDVLGASEPWEPLADSLTVTAVSGPPGAILTFASVPSGISAGDYVCLAGEAPFVQLPSEYFSVLAQRVANQLLRGGTDTKSLEEGIEALAKMEAPLLAATETRDEGSGDFVVQRGLSWNGSSRRRDWCG